MRSLTRPMRWSIAGLLILLASIAFLPLGKRTWVRLSGAVVADGSATYSYMNKPVRILSAEGWRSISWNESERASAYHALVIFPGVDVEDIENTSRGGSLIHVQTGRWRVLGRETENGSDNEIGSDIKYDAVWNTITVGSETYYLAGRNMFLIRFDQQRHPLIRQLAVTMDPTTDFEKVVEVFKSNLGDDAAKELL